MNVQTNYTLNYTLDYVTAEPSHPSSEDFRGAPVENSSGPDARLPLNRCNF